MELNENSVKILEMIRKKGSGRVIEYLKEIIGIEAAKDCVYEVTDELERNDFIGTKNTLAGHSVAWITPEGRKYLKNMNEKD